MNKIGKSAVRANCSPNWVRPVAGQKPMPWWQFGNRGFNLFTALVAVVLVILAVVLTSAMTSSERNIVDTISDIEEEQKMQTIADLARADALHAFNFGIRFAIEQWLTEDDLPPHGIPENTYVLTTDIARQSWDDVLKDFANSEFGICEQTASGQQCHGTQLATRAANHLTNLLERTPDVRGYNVDLEAPNTVELEGLLQKVFDKSSEQEDFFTVIDCDGTWNGCHSGAFYINLNLKKPAEGGYLTDEEYEKFPKIVVTNTGTERVLKEPILPRGEIQIFVPVRIFKALAGGKTIADKGVFEESFRKQIDSLKVGICGVGCFPIADPFNADTSAGLFSDAQNFACVGDPIGTIGGSLLSSVPILFSGLFGAGPSGNSYDYDPNSEASMRSRLGEFVENELLNPKINQVANGMVPDEEHFKIVKDSANSALSVNAIVLAQPSRSIHTSGGQGRVGDAFCSKVRRVEATIVFEETDEKYIVSNALGEPNRYGVTLLDTAYSEFTLPSSAGGGLRICRTVGRNQELGTSNYSCEEVPD